MGLLNNKKGPIINQPEDMSPLESVTHLFAAIQLVDQDANYEERISWSRSIAELFPELSMDRAENFLNESYQVLSGQTSSDRSDYLVRLLDRINTLLSPEQINSMGPKIADLIEADGIVMTSEMEIAKLIETRLNIKISIDEDL
tara:strand:- start:101 stop:532 length:432 start_codon:yes stop_codon:yes gene_type:complete